ncbi:MAG: hypothetical protein ABI699_05735 [Caldimonas sp.]
MTRFAFRSPFATLLRRVLLLGALLFAGTAWAVLARADLGLQHAGTSCDGKGSYRYTASWRAQPNATFQVNSGNQCKVGGTVCGISTTGCTTRCSKSGVCKAEMQQCLVGRGGAWGRVMATDRSVYQQINAVPPGKCQ